MAKHRRDKRWVIVVQQLRTWVVVALPSPQARPLPACLADKGKTSTFCRRCTFPYPLFATKRNIVVTGHVLHPRHDLRTSINEAFGSLSLLSSANATAACWYARSRADRWLPPPALRIAPFTSSASCCLRVGVCDVIQTCDMHRSGRLGGRSISSHQTAFLVALHRATALTMALQGHESRLRAMNGQQTGLTNDATQQQLIAVLLCVQRVATRAAAARISHTQNRYACYITELIISITSSATGSVTFCTKWHT